MGHRGRYSLLKPQSGRLVKRRVSEKEGRASLDKLLAKIDEGKLKPPRENKVDELCEVCHRRVRAARVVPSLIAGHKMPGTKFQGTFVVACTGRDGKSGCAKMLEQAGVPQRAAEQTSRMMKLGLVIP